MKLELKHLAPYLPYDLEFYVEHANGTRLDNWAMTIDTNLRIVLEHQNKPILRPLSGLTDEYINKFYNNNEIDIVRMTYAIVINYKMMGDYFKDTISFLRYNGAINLTMPAWIYVELLENHFDVFGLIEKGLAIDINTIK